MLKVAKTDDELERLKEGAQPMENELPNHCSNHLTVFLLAPSAANFKKLGLE